jgi:hypothetical protein
MLNPRQSSNKYHARKMRDDNYVFDSMVEHRRYCELRLLLRAGEITDLVVHPAYEIKVNGVKIARYTADFRYLAVKTQQEIVEDVKGAATRTKRDYRLICKLMWAVHHIRVIEILY